jgi:integrase
MWIEQRIGARGTRYKCHVEKINDRTGVEVKKSKTFIRKAEAEEWGRNLENDLSRGRFTDTRQIDSQELAQYIQAYISHLTPAEGMMPAKVGWKQEVTLLKAWLTNPLTSRPISKITVPDLLDHVRTRRRTHSKRTKKGAQPIYVSEQTIKHELIAISNTFQFAKTYYQLEGLENPVRAIPKDLKPQGSREISVRILPENWKKLEPLLKTRRNKFYVHAAELAIETALRQGELLRLEPKDLHTGDNLKTKYIVATDFRQEGGKVVAHIRKIPLTNRALVIVKAVLALRAKLKNDQSPTIWGTICADGLSRAFREDCEAVGIRDDSGRAATFHSTRHEASSRMAVHIPINKLMKITGHKTVGQLMRYYNPTIDDLGDAIAMMNIRKVTKKNAAKKDAT